MDEMGEFPQLAHHSTSAMKHRGNVPSSVSLFRAHHCFSFISSHTQPFSLSSLIFHHSILPSLGPIIFLSALLLLFPGSPSFIQCGIISHLHSISFLAYHFCIFHPLLCTYKYSPLSLHTAFTQSPPCLFSTISTYDCPWVELSVRNLSLSQQINYNYT